MRSKILAPSKSDLAPFFLAVFDLGRILSRYLVGFLLLFVFLFISLFLVFFLDSVL